MDVANSAVTRLASSQQHSGGIPFLVFGVVLVVIGSLNATTPEWSWKMRRWQYRNKDAMAPSDAALRFTRIVGVLAVLAGLIIIIVNIVRLS